MKVSENAKELWDNPEDLIEAWKYMPDKSPRELLIVKLLEDCYDIVDLGCGNGRLYNHLRHKNYIGYDTSLPMVLEAKKSYLDKHSDDKDRFSVIDITRFQPNIRYDAVVCQDVAQHYDQPIELIETVIRNWSASLYIFSLLVGDNREELYNSTVIPLSEFLVFLRTINEGRTYADSTYTYIEPFDDTSFSWMLFGLFSKD